MLLSSVARLRINPRVRASVHDKGMVLLDIHGGLLYVSNLTGARIWQAIAGDMSPANISLELSREYGIPRETADADTLAFLAELRDRGLVDVTESHGEYPIWIANRMFLTLAALWELIRHDAVLALFGFRAVLDDLNRTPVAPSSADNCEMQAAIDRAISKASIFYWKPVRCLQHSVALARLLRRCGLPATVVIGYRDSPLVSHAWVEANGRTILSDRRLDQGCFHVLERLGL
jgi:hypothetical protein